MPMVTCPSCKKADQVPDKFIGARLKCKKCGTSILVTAQGAQLIPAAAVGAAAPAPAPATAAAGATANSAKAATLSGIEVEGLDLSAWTTVSVPPPLEPEPERVALESAAAPTADWPVQDGEAPRARPREYKLLTPKDKYFDGKFEIGRLEEALNYYARQGWVARSMATPHIAGFSGGAKEELVVLLER